MAIHYILYFNLQPESLPSVVKTINERPNFMKPTYGLTKSERKKNRSQMRSTYSNIDISFNPSLNISTVSVLFIISNHNLMSKLNFI